MVKWYHWTFGTFERRFDSCYRDHDIAVVQRIRILCYERRGGGSIPSSGTKFLKESPNGQWQDTQTYGGETLRWSNWLLTSKIRIVPEHPYHIKALLSALWEAQIDNTRTRFESKQECFFCPGDGIGIRVGLRSQILGVQVSSGVPTHQSIAQLDRATPF